MLKVKSGTVVTVICAVLMTVSGPGFAQTPSQTTPSSNTPTKSASTPDDNTVVTIRGQKKRRDRTAVKIDTQSAGSCGFAQGYSATDDATFQNYMDDFYADGHGSPDDPDADQTDPTSSGARIRDTGPNGNATQDQTTAALGPDGQPTTSSTGGFTAQQPGGCTSADVAFAAGRNYILRKDHSLKDAYAAFDAGDYQKALSLFETAYNKIGYDQAAFMMGKMYLSGLGTPRDTAKAIYWLKQVAEAKFAPGDEQTFDPADPYYMSTRSDATMTLAKIYLTGFDVPKNVKEAKKWFSKADEIGYVPAAHVMGQIYKTGLVGEKNINKAIKYFDKAGHLGFTPSQFELGLIYYNGDGVPEDRKMAAKWLMAAASGGHPDALFAVARMYDLGDTLPQDSNKALLYYKEAALKGQPEAQAALGTYFYTGEILAQDFVTARKWFEIAAKAGNADAMFNLAVMLTRGEGGDKNVMLAYVWFKLAALSGLEKAEPAATEVAARLTPDERAKAEAILNPPAK